MLLTGLCCLSPNYEHIWLTQNQFMCRNQTIKKVSLLKPGHPFMQMNPSDLHGMAMSKQSWTWLHMYLELQGGPSWVEPWAAFAKFLLWCRGSMSTISSLQPCHPCQPWRQSKDIVIYPCESAFWYPWSQVFSTPKSCTPAQLRLLTVTATLWGHVMIII